VLLRARRVLGRHILGIFLQTSRRQRIVHTGAVYIAFIVDCYAQRIVAWHASTSKSTNLVRTRLRMAI